MATTPANPWPAVDVTTLPAAHALALRRFWDASVADFRFNAVRSPIADLCHSSLHHAADWRNAHRAVTRLAEERAALRRVAALVAGQAAAEEIFAAVALEAAQLVGADRGTVCRYESDDSMMIAACWTRDDTEVPVGARVSLAGDGVAAMIRRSAGPRRVDSHEGLHGPVAEDAGSIGCMPHSAVGAPIVVDGRIWGAILVSTTRSDPLAEDAEQRITDFTELVATAIANAVGRTELAASRARIVATADATRRRLERDLHDGLQQRLVTLTLELQGVRASATPEALLAGLSHVESEIGSALEELREISRGIHPAILSKGGLAPAVRTLARRSGIPVEVDVPILGELPEPVEVAAYYVVSEALANAAKHAGASAAWVTVLRRNGTLSVSVSDDGAGGADPGRGSGLIGLRDRVEAVGGTFDVVSPVGVGTCLRAALPTTS